MIACMHENLVPVESGGEVVATLCTDCDAQLDAGFGCEDCTYAEIVFLEGPVTRVLDVPCRVHR